jgi:hypothetical protein
LHSISKRAPFRLHLNELLHSAATFSSSTTTQEDAQAQLHEILAALCHSFPGTAELNLASLPLGNEGVVLVQKNLLNLAFLKLSGCKKLTSDAVIAVIKPTSTATATSAVSGSTSRRPDNTVECMYTTWIETLLCCIKPSRPFFLDIENFFKIFFFTIDSPHAGAP